MRSVLLLGVNLFAIHKIVAGGNRGCSALHSSLRESHYGRDLAYSMVVHFEEFHLLRGDGWACSVAVRPLVHHGKPHRAGHENIISIVVRRGDLGRVDVVVLVRRLDRLEVGHVLILIRVERHVPPIVASRNLPFLIMAVELLDVQASSSLVVAQGRSWPCFKGLAS